MSPKMTAILATRTAPMIGYMPAYANTLSTIVPAIYAAMDTVSRELVGFLPSVMRNTSADRVAVGQSIVYPIAPVQAAYDVIPSMTTPEPPDNAFDTGSMAITKSRAVPFGFTGEEQKFLNSGGVGHLSAQGMIIAQAVRTLTNEMETDLSNEAASNASRAYGTAGTTPFGSGDLTDLAQLQKILDDNGAPPSMRSAILSTSAGARLQAIGNLSKVNESGTQMTLRQGELLDIYGMSIKKTGQPYSHAKSPATGYSTSGTAYAKGATVITMAAGTGTATQGDVVTFAGDSNKYLIASVQSATQITLARPGLRVAIPAAATAITFANTYEAAGVAFSMDAIQWAGRAPAKPVEGDDRLDDMMITDPRSGMVFEFSIWPGYRKVRGEIAAAWGQKTVKTSHVALLLG